MPQKPTIPRSCETCGTDFLAYANDVRRGRGRFCSPRCVRRPDSPTSEIERLTDGSVRMPLYAKKNAVVAHVIIDASDTDFAMQWRWRLGSDGYAKRGRRVHGVYLNIYLHRELLGLSNVHDGREVDHIDRVRLNCRRVNLRILNHAGNMQNQPGQRTSTSGYRGVSWSTSHQKWVAAIGVNGRTLWLGRFATELEAAEVVAKERRRLLPHATD